MSRLRPRFQNQADRLLGLVSEESKRSDPLQLDRDLISLDPAVLLEDQTVGRFEFAFATARTFVFRGLGATACAVPRSVDYMF